LQLCGEVTEMMRRRVEICLGPVVFRLLGGVQPRPLFSDISPEQGGTLVHWFLGHGGPGAVRRADGPGLLARHCLTNGKIGPTAELELADRLGKHRGF
jgi:hypothetical protein